jgi:uncharacterized Fe-S center protein
MLMANVYWIKGRCETVQKNLVSQIDALFRLDELAAVIKPEASLAIKFNLSEMGYSQYLPPVIFSSIFEKARAQGAKPVLTDSGSLFKGSRFDGYSWLDSALLHGLSAGEIFHNQLMQAGGYTNEEGNFWPVDGKQLAGVDIGSLLTDTAGLLVVSHITAHPLLGLSGAVSNLGLGLLTNSGKLKVHACLQVDYDKNQCDQCGICLPYCPTGALSGQAGAVAFDSRICNNCLGCFISCPRAAIRIQPETIAVYQQCVVEAAQTVRQHLRGKAFFINFLKSITPQPDEYPFSDIPFVPDLGIVASDDPVAADWVTYQMITQSPGIPGSIAQNADALAKGIDKLKAITGQSPEPMLAYAEEMKLGSRQLEFLISG